MSVCALICIIEVAVGVPVEMTNHEKKKYVQTWTGNYLGKSKKLTSTMWCSVSLNPIYFMKKIKVLLSLLLRYRNWGYNKLSEVFKTT